MVNEMENFVSIEGLLSEINLKETSYNKNEVDVPCIKGDIKVRVVTELEKGAEPTTLEILVNYFSNKYTSSGNENPSYKNLMELIHNGNSIAAVGEDSADAVRIGSGKISMNEFYTPDGRLISYPCINASFVNIIKRSEMVYKAKADVQAIIGKMQMQTDKDGIETDTLQITGIVVGYNEYTNVIPFITKNPTYISALKATYSEGDLIKMNVRLNFSSKTETYYEEVEIGEPIEKTKTVNVNDLIIVGVSGSEIGGEEITIDKINQLVDSRTKRLEKAKEKATSKGVGRTKEKEKAKVNLGF